MSKDLKSIVAILAILLTVIVTLSFLSNEEKQDIMIDSPESGQIEANKPFKVGIVLSIGGLGDKSYNDLAYEGIRLAQKKLESNIVILNRLPRLKLK